MPAMVVIVAGLEGTGKTTVAKALGKMIDGTVLSTDKIRKELFSKPTNTKEEMSFVYDVMMVIAKYLHENNVNCILDATFRWASHRQKVKDVLRPEKGRFFTVVCTCPEAVSISRILNRKNDFSDADRTRYNWTKSIYEPIDSPDLVVDTSKDESEIMNLLSAFLKSQS